MQKKPLLAMFLGAGWEQWDETYLQKEGIGGSETAAIWMGRELSSLGYEVKIFANPFSQHFDEKGYDVEYLHYSSWKTFAAKFTIDILITSRTLYPLNTPSQIGQVYVWIHDVFLHPDRSFDCKVDQVDAYLCLSPWHKELVHTHHNIPLDKIRVTANGIDPSRYEKPCDKLGSQVFYSSSPDRGLDTLLYCAKFIRKFIPDFTVVVAYGFSNWEKAAKIRNDPQEFAYMKSIKAELDKPYVRYLGRVDQKILALTQKQSSAWLYPTRFHETFCITAVEAGFARVPILSSKQAGLISTVQKGGILLEGDAYTKEYRKLFVEEAVKLLTHKSYNEQWADRAYQRMQRFTWEAVAMQWHQLFEKKVWNDLL